jgi:hypothetical protein
MKNDTCYPERIYVTVNPDTDGSTFLSAETTLNNVAKIGKHVKCAEYVFVKRMVVATEVKTQPL